MCGLCLVTNFSFRHEHYLFLRPLLAKFQLHFVKMSNASPTHPLFGLVSVTFQCGTPWTSSTRDWNYVLQ